MQTPPVRFEWNVSLGHILTLATLLISAAFAWSDLNNKVKNNEEHIAAADARIDANASRIEQNASAQAALSARIYAANTEFEKLAVTIGSMESLLQEVRSDIRTVIRDGRAAGR